MKKLPEWVHFVGICGVVTSGLAVMFKYNGVKITGSDKGFFPPISTYLEKYDIQIAIGYKAERLTDEDGKHPDLVIVQGLKGEKNLEYQEALRLGIPIKSYPSVLSEYVITNESIVVAGTYGKTTITAALVSMFEKAKIEISYMYGGVSPEMKETTKAQTQNTKYSIVEGDEYLTSLSDKTSKFFYYNPKYLIINSCQWEHPDLFPTQAEYIANFKKLIDVIPQNGIIIANANDKNVVEITQNANCRVIYYSANKDNAYIQAHWYLENTSKPLPTFVKLDRDIADLEIIPYERKIIGEFNEENLLASTALAYEFGIKKERIQEAISEFKGIKRRLEIKYQNQNFIIIDDFGSSPPKARGSIKALKGDYPDSEIYVIFEPNTGNRTEASLATYENAFEDVDEIIFPRFTRLPKTGLYRFNEQELSDRLKQYYSNITVVPDDGVLLKLLVKYIELGPDKHKIIIFMGSHGFRGMIDNLVKYFSIA